MEINDEVKQKMLEYLQQFEAGVKSAAEFSSEQAPLVVQEYLAWVFVLNISTCVLGLIVLVVGTFLGLKLHKRLEPLDRIGVEVFGPFLWIAIAMFTLGGAYHAAKVAVAPRVVVLEKISELVVK